VSTCVGADDSEGAQVGSHTLGPMVSSGPERGHPVSGLMEKRGPAQGTSIIILRLSKGTEWVHLVFGPIASIGSERRAHGDLGGLKGARVASTYIGTNGSREPEWDCPAFGPMVLRGPECGGQC
jgi:hypothetical protein